eukprot:TRINITY_DN8099_c0_g1_i1.p1 TRINITY_DN8099_c0_g1~~TRINITY_DN8099_c0_g1_i1.p1  ORF type:complete len:438 (-),score=59.78 TRINITY_DN8099_c0_g1_i1:7-1167(-)
MSSIYKRQARHLRHTRGVSNLPSTKGRAPGVALLGVAPWLQEPQDLDEAYGLRKRDRGDREDKKVELPAMQQSFKERLRNIAPYPDIVRQVYDDFQGKGGLRRAKIANAKKLRMQRNRQAKKPEQPTELERKALQMANSRSERYAQAPLSFYEQHPKPDPNYAEVAFIGRSNVGKSSMMNRVTQFGTVAKVSSMPGQTKHVAWYRNRKVKVDFIDMPGYGPSARARVFGPDALEFVKNRTSLKALYVLIDARIGFRYSDHEWLEDLGKEGPVKQIILTKCDLVPPKDLIKIASLARSDLEQFRRVDRKLLLCSSAWQTGMHDIRLDVCKRCGLADNKNKQDEDPFSIRRPDMPLRATQGQELGILRRSMFDDEGAADEPRPWAAGM